MTERPDGSQATFAGWVLISLGILAAIIASGAETLNGMVWGVAFANLGIGLGIILVSLGYLVKAIWFLPGREKEIEEQSLTRAKADRERPASAASEDCEWCGLNVLGPSRPCSMQTEGELKKELAVVDIEKIPTACRDTLAVKGYFES